LLDDLGLWAALEWQLSEFGKRTGIKCTLEALCENSTELGGCDSTVFSPQISIALFRVVQETLTNVARHASATQVDIGCQVSDVMVILSIKDNGIGFDTALTEKPSSHGIRGMYERAGSMGGNLEIDSKLNSGTTIKIRLPMNEHENHA
jgi:signal transduction histidine kinase